MKILEIMRELRDCSDRGFEQFSPIGKSEGEPSLETAGFKFLGRDVESRGQEYYEIGGNVFRLENDVLSLVKMRG